MKPRAPIVLVAPITIRALSEKLGVKTSQILKVLLDHKVLATINQTLDPDVVKEIAVALGIPVEFRKTKAVEDETQTDATLDRPESLKPRPPIVTLLGHVDHGKTSLLDAIRNTNVAAGEAGGITQHMGAYRVVSKGGKPVIFLDTPGHEAFTAMRARGANVTDVVVLVVAADDGVMPQTEEAIHHAQAAEVPIVVALNKMDKPEASPMKVKQQLSSLGLIPSEWGGKTEIVEVSALTKMGIENLLEILALETELLELKANPKKPAQGTVLEASRTQGQGIVVTLIVQEGTLHRGDMIVAGSTLGRVRALLDEHGRPLKEAGPTTPARVLGFGEPPQAGDRFSVTSDIVKARAIVEGRTIANREAALAKRRHVTLSEFRSLHAKGKVRELRIILKADVQGSLEALVGQMETLRKGDVTLRILHQAIGNITASDVYLADASDATIIGLHVGVEEMARVAADERQVETRLYDIILKPLEDLHAALEGMLEPEEKPSRIGFLEVRSLFEISRFGTIAGSFVTQGRITRDSTIYVMHERRKVFEGRLASLKRFKDDVREVTTGLECGIRIEGFNDVQVGDVLEAWRQEKPARKSGS